jgi:hypothetical protein
MVYSKQTWVDGEQGGTPITAARLGHIEDGVEAAQSGASVADSRLALYGTTMLGVYVVMAVQEQAGTDLTLSEDGTTVTFNTEGVYAIDYTLDGPPGTLGYPDTSTWTYNRQVSGAIYATTEEGEPSGSLVHRFAAGDTTSFSAAGGSGGSMNIVRLA